MTNIEMFCLSSKDYFETDAEFCERALAWLDQGKEVWYSPWW